MRFVTISQAREALTQLGTMAGQTQDVQLSQAVSSVKLKKIPVETFEPSQLKRILIVICKEKELVVSNFVDLSKITVPIFQEAFQKILNDLGMISAKTDELYVYGGQNGYLSSRFHRDTRNLILVHDATEYDCDIDQVSIGSLIILDSDVTEILYPKKDTQQGPLSNGNGGEKRMAMDDTLFMGHVPDNQKLKLDGENRADDEEALKALPDWESLKVNPAIEDLVGRLQEFYTQKINTIAATYEDKVKLVEDTIEKKKEEAKNFRELVEEEEATIRSNVEAMQQQLLEAQTARDNGLQQIKNLEDELQSHREEVQNLRSNRVNQTMGQGMEVDMDHKPVVKTNASNFLEEPTTDTLPEKNSVADAKVPRINPITNDKGQTQVKPATIGKFGIKVWNEDSSLLDHMAQVAIGLEVAAESGHTALSVQKSLIFQSLPAKCQWTRSYVAGETTVEGIIRRIVTLLEGGRELQLHHFMKIQRKRNEPLLEFFTKIRRIYGFSVDKKDSDLESDPAAVSFMVQKMVEAMEESTAQEFTKRIESDLENGDLTFSKIADAIIRITRLAMKSNMTTGILAQVKSGQVKRCNKCNKRGHDEVNCWKDITCSKCNNRGHPDDRCRKFPAEGQKRETGTDGRTCFECKQKGHLRANCPNREAKDHSKWSQNQ